MTDFDDAMDGIPEQDDTDSFEPSDDEKAELLRNASLNFATHIPHADVDSFIADASKLYGYITKGVDTD